MKDESKYNLIVRIHDDEDIFMDCDLQDADEYIADCQHLYRIFYYLAFERGLLDHALAFARFQFPQGVARLESEIPTGG